MAVSELAANGAAFLDERVPNWYKRVNPATLDIASSVNCVLGQLYGSYWVGVSELDINEGKLPARLDLGFTMIGVWGAEPMSALTDGWREEIATRRLKELQSTPELVAVN